MNSEELNQRINQHFMSDGLLEILFGLLVLFGTLVFVNVYQNDLYPILGQLFFGAAVIVALGPGLRFLKKQFTHPRIGYFKQKHSQETKQQSYAIYMVGLVAIAFIFFMTIVMGLLLTADNVNFQHMADFMFSLFPVVMSIALAAPYFFIAVQSKLPRYFILGGDTDFYWRVYHESKPEPCHRHVCYSHQQQHDCFVQWMCHVCKVFT